MCGLSHAQAIAVISATLLPEFNQQRAQEC
jgi:hypothetical protein